MTDPAPPHVRYRIEGLLRCCLESVPDRAGTSELEHVACRHCTDKEHSGVVWHDGAWEAAWITRGHAP